LIKTSTCIVGIRHNGTVYIGGDSFSATDSSGFVNKTKKVFHLQGKEDLVVGYTSSFRMGQLLQYSTDLFDEDDFKIAGKIDEKYLVNTFIPKVQDLFSRGGYQTKNNEELHGGNFLLGYKGKLYNVQTDYSILEREDDYVAIGCGDDFALGSLHTTSHMDYSVEQRIKLALLSASKFSVYVSPPFYMVDTNSMEVKEL